MTEHETNESDARQALAGRIDEMRVFLAANPFDDETFDEIANYGLEWTKAITDHRAGTVTYVHVLSTGGPHDEFQVTFDPDRGTVDGVTFVYLPWFDRVEIDERDFPDRGADESTGMATVRDFYATFYGELVMMDCEAGR
jgi:hypothetical protein